MSYVIIKQYKDENYGFYNNRGFPSQISGKTRVFPTMDKAQKTADRLYRHHLGYELEVVSFSDACRIDIDQQNEAIHNHALASMEDF